MILFVSKKHIVYLNKKLVLGFPPQDTVWRPLAAPSGPVVPTLFNMNTLVAVSQAIIMR